MKFIVPVICVFGMLLLSSGTVSTTNQLEPKSVDQPIVPVVVDLHISEYPGPFLNMGGQLKYHVLINGRIVGMHDEDAQALLDIFNITPYTSDQFHELGLDHQIWAFKRKGNGFTNHLVSGRTR